MVAVFAIAAAFFWLRGPVSDLISNTRDAFGDQSVDGPRKLIDDAPQPGPEPGRDTTTKGYSNIRAVVGDLHEGGFPCASTSVDAAGGTVMSGSCQSRGTHVQINIYLDGATLAFAETRLYDKDWPFDYVHKDNWYVSSTVPVVREIQRVLGGKFHPAGGR